LLPSVITHLAIVSPPVHLIPIVLDPFLFYPVGFACSRPMSVLEAAGGGSGGGFSPFDCKDCGTCPACRAIDDYAREDEAERLTRDESRRLMLLGLDIRPYRAGEGDGVDEEGDGEGGGAAGGEESEGDEDASLQSNAFPTRGQQAARAKVSRALSATQRKNKTRLLREEQEAEDLLRYRDMSDKEYLDWCAEVRNPPCALPPLFTARKCINLASHSLTMCRKIRRTTTTPQSKAGRRTQTHTWRF
jgi:hypothetical protein